MIFVLKIMATIKRFEELEMWKLSRELNKMIGELIDEKKFENNFRLINQVEGSSGSIMDNIAEGFERGSRAEFILFLGYSKGSCGELRSQLYRMIDRKYISQENFEDLYNRAIIINSKINNVFAEINYKRNKEKMKKSFRNIKH